MECDMLDVSGRKHTGCDQIRTKDKTNFAKHKGTKRQKKRKEAGVQCYDSSANCTEEDRAKCLTRGVCFITAFLRYFDYCVT